MSIGKATTVTEWSSSFYPLEILFRDAQLAIKKNSQITEQNSKVTSLSREILCALDGIIQYLPQIQQQNIKELAQYVETISDSGEKSFLEHSAHMNALLIKIEQVAFLSLSEKNESSAQIQRDLGWCYNNGIGVAQDRTKAVALWHKAAEQQDAFAQCYLGISYYYGRGVPMDHEKAVKWWKLGAEQGEVHSQFWLGLCYRKGEGVVQNYDAAVKWLSLAS